MWSRERIADFVELHEIGAPGAEPSVSPVGGTSSGIGDDRRSNEEFDPIIEDFEKSYGGE
jgi:hypothetical protein